MNFSKTSIAIVVSTFNSDITEQLLEGALTTLINSGFKQENISIVKVPGAVEIPLAAQWLALSKKPAAIIGLGAVIQGDTNHYDYVCQQVSSGSLEVMLKFNLPVIFGVLTTKNYRQAKARVCYQKEHKGVEAAQCAMHMIQLQADLKIPLATEKEEY